MVIKTNITSVGFALIPRSETPNEFDWKLDDNISVFVITDHTAVHIIVPKGFPTDLASIPKLFWNIYPPFGNHTFGAIVHDYLYRNCGLDKLSKKECDEVFLNLMLMKNTPVFRAKVFYYAVRVFGIFTWKKYNCKKD